jgi:hypothetical protein
MAQDDGSPITDHLGHLLSENVEYSVKLLNQCLDRADVSSEQWTSLAECLDDPAIARFLNERASNSAVTASPAASAASKDRSSKPGMGMGMGPGPVPVPPKRGGRMSVRRATPLQQDEDEEVDLEMPFPGRIMDLLSDEIQESIGDTPPEVLYARLGSIVDGLIVSRDHEERGVTLKHTHWSL